MFWTRLVIVFIVRCESNLFSPSFSSFSQLSLCWPRCRNRSAHLFSLPLTHLANTLQNFTHLPVAQLAHRAGYFFTQLILDIAPQWNGKFFCHPQPLPSTTLLTRRLTIECCHSICHLTRFLASITTPSTNFTFIWLLRCKVQHEQSIVGIV